MKEFKDRARKLAARQAGEAQVEAVQVLAALEVTLEQIRADVAQLAITVGTVQNRVTAMTAQEISERLDPLAQHLDDLRRRISDLERHAAERGDWGGAG